MADVLTHIEGGMGRITLNRPRSLNALTLGMVEAVSAALDAWEAEPAVAFVLIEGAGERGLCAGGDIRALYDAALAGIASVNEDFFRAEYQLNGRIAGYAKPYVALMDGLVMGGGVGVSAHGSHRIVTERSRIAMPETGIGFFPDIGATWLLSRTPFQFGTHMGLTGEAIGADDAIRAGLADIHVASDRLPALVEALRDCSASGLDACVKAFATPPEPGLFAEGRDWIATCYGGDDVAAIVAALAAHGNPAALRAAEVIKGRSPTSLDSCLDREFRMAVIRTRQHDFIEGVRAAVVDKDRKPRWVPARLDEVGADDLASFFAAADRQPPLWSEPAR
jgi:enoyl-CoA hydratase